VTYENNILYHNGNDWGVNHTDTTSHAGNDAQLIAHNYWQQGGPNVYDAGLTEVDNTVITGPAQVPASLMQRVGIQPAYASILDWQPPGVLVPNAPELVRVLYAFKGSAYVTWKPSFAQSGGPVTAYTVQACLQDKESQEGQCGLPVGSPVSISASAFDQTGYVAVAGLHDGSWYSFQVTAWNAQGPGTPSIPSPYVRPVAGAPRKPERANSVGVSAAKQGVVLQWWPPHNLDANFNRFAIHDITAYVITSNQGQVWIAQGLEQLYNSGCGGRTMYAIDGLKPGTAYRFSIAAANPGGVGKAVWSSSVRPLK